MFDLPGVGLVNRKLVAARLLGNPDPVRKTPVRARKSTPVAAFRRRAALKAWATRRANDVRAAA